MQFWGLRVPKKRAQNPWGGLDAVWGCQEQFWESGDSQEENKEALSWMRDRWRFLGSVLGSEGTRKQGEEALGAGVDDIDLMQRHRVNDFAPLLQLPIRALHEFRLGRGREFRGSEPPQNPHCTPQRPPKTSPVPPWRRSPVLG